MRILLLSSGAETSKSLLNILHAEQYYVIQETSLVESVIEIFNDFDLILLESQLTINADPKDLLDALVLGESPSILLYSSVGHQQPAPGFRLLPGVRYYSQPMKAAQLLREVVHQEVRYSAAENTTSITLADLHLNAYEKTVTRAGKLIKLTLKEFLLLKYLLIHKNRLVIRADIIQQLWGTCTAQRQNSLTSCINLLRDKIDAGHTQQLLHTLRGRGYMLRTD